MIASGCLITNYSPTLFGSSQPEVFLEKAVLKICSKFTGEHPCRSVISIKLLCRAPFIKSTSGWLLLIIPMESIEFSVHVFNTFESPF